MPTGFYEKWGLAGLMGLNCLKGAEMLGFDPTSVKPISVTLGFDGFDPMTKN